MVTVVPLAGVCQVAAVLLVAVRTCPVVGAVAVFTAMVVVADLRALVLDDVPPPASNVSTCDFKYAVLFARFFSGALIIPVGPPVITTPVSNCVTPASYVAVSVKVVINYFPS
jgi:hypothetical protein